jgi:hypothetical protein
MSLAIGEKLSAETFDDFVQRLRHHVRGEGVDWHYTADALFTVQARRIIFGIDKDYTDKWAVYVDDSMYFSVLEYWGDQGPDSRARLHRLAQEQGGCGFMSLSESDQWDILADLPEHTVSGWDERWDIVNVHFTKEGAEAFIRRKMHDYRDGLRIYVEAQVYCWEFNAIIKGLLDGSIVFTSTPEVKGNQSGDGALGEKGAE